MSGVLSQVMPMPVAVHPPARQLDRARRADDAVALGVGGVLGEHGHAVGPYQLHSPSSTIVVAFLPSCPSLPVIVKVRSPLRSSKTIVTPCSLLVPSL